MSPMKSPDDAPFLNRLAHRMFEYADPRADQNIWDLARAAEEVMREAKGEVIVAAYGGTLTEQQRMLKEQLGNVPTGRMVMNPVPMTFAEKSSDHTAQLGEIKRLLFAKMPSLARSGMSARDLVDQLIQDHQAMEQTIDQQRVENSELAQFKEKLHIAEDVIGQVRGALDPDGQFEDESIIVLARERMNLLAARQQELQKLKMSLGAVVEDESAERLRTLLGADGDENLAALAKRVKDERDRGWMRVEKLEGEHEVFDTKIRKLVGAIEMSESDDHYVPQQPTLDAVVRLVHRLCEVDREADGCAKTREDVLSGVQMGWLEDGFGELEA